MKFQSFLLSMVLLLGLSSCNQEPSQKDPEGTVYYTESDENFPNPERGFYSQITYTKATEPALTTNRLANYRNTNGQSLIMLMYYLTDYKETDIAPEYLQLIDKNMKMLREGGVKCVLRFAYSSNNNNTQKPWDATEEQVLRHIDQLTPYLQEYADVILCLQAGFVGVWGEWYYTTNFNQSPSNDAAYEPRRHVLNALLDALPETRQICVRTPKFKIMCLNLDSESDTLTDATAYKNTPAARVAGHNDCFLATTNDMGTYSNQKERTFWQRETRYTIMGGETCGECGTYSQGPNAIQEMTKFHWTYLNNLYHKDVLNSWTTDGSMDTIRRRLGYRFVLRKALYTAAPKADSLFSAKLHIENIGFASPVNPRDVELVFVSTADTAKKYVYKQDIDPRFWKPAETTEVNLSCKLDAGMAGEYHVYLNLPDPCETLKEDPRFSIRMANTDMWDDSTGYNLLTTIIL